MEKVSRLVSALPSPLPVGLRSGPAEDFAGRRNMQQLIQLRWIAVLGQLVTILVAHYGFGIALPMLPMMAVLAGLVLFNVASLLRLRLSESISNLELFAALLVDVAMLSAQLFLSGGTSNPFIFLYLLQVVLGAVLLEAWSAWIIFITTIFCFIWLAYMRLPLVLPIDHGEGLASIHVQGMLVSFVLCATLLVIFINRITHTRRERDARIAELRQRAVEEEHIVRMGLLASGAAHELGTPLATLSVILGDWRHMEPFQSDPDMAQEVAEMQTQVLRCKSIVSGILLSAGEARGESSEETLLGDYLDELLGEWQRTRPVQELSYQNRIEQRGLHIVSDSVLTQTIHNVLDNALEASPHWVGLEVSLDDDRLILTVLDNGQGFPAKILERLGQPYQSTKGREGRGLGLFLVVNVIRTLGGNVQASNRPEGGARVELSLPLSSITLEE